jgi:hypothetical protein
MDKYSDSFMLHSVAPRFVDYKHQAPEKSSRMLRMKTVQEIRYENLERLVMKAAGEGGDLGRGLSKLVDLAAERGKDLSRPTLYQILTKKKTSGGATRNVGDDLAREIEDALRLERGWMDNEHETQGTSMAAPAIATDLAELIAVFCHTNELGREAMRSAMKIARQNIPATAGDQLEKLDFLPLGGKI